MKVEGLVKLFIFCSILVPLFCSAAQSLDIVINKIAWPVKAAYAANRLRMGTVIINEVAWMGTDVSANDEWIELYNSTSSEINLDNWKLIAQDGTPEISLSGKINAQGFFILERTNDDSLPNVQSDQIYTGALSNKGEFLQLFDEQGNVIDEVNCKDGWFAGDNQTKQTMERIGLNWQTSQNPGGTPGALNSKGAEETNAESKPESPDETDSRQIVYPKGIIISEVLPSPEGPDAENEYIEIFNQNDFEVDISGWSLQDTEGKTKVFVFPTGARIEAKDYLVFFRPQTKITLNNSGDGVQLLQPDKKTADEVYYGKAPQGESFNRVGSDWAWSSNLTPRSENVLAGIKEKTEDQEGLKNKEQQEKPLEIRGEELLGALSDILPQQSLAFKNFFSILSIALIIAFISSIVILILKKKLAFKVRP